MKLTVGLSILAGLCLAGAASARVVCVDRRSAAPAPDGSGWSAAYRTIAEGLAAARSGDEVWAAAGTYPESVSVLAGVSLYGGFDGTETSLEQRGLRAHLTVLDGSGQTSDAIVNCYNGSIIVDGLTVRNGTVGVYVWAGTPIISRCTISRCSYAGVVFQSVNGILEGSVVTSCHIGVAMAGIVAVLANDTLAGNGTGVSAQLGFLTTANTIIAYNLNFGLIRSSNAVVTSFANNDVFGNFPYDFQNYTPPSDTGNMSQEPAFVDMPNGDLRLRPWSPCVDAGENALVRVGSTDRDGDLRTRGPHVDMGAFEYVPYDFYVNGAAPGPVHDGFSWETAFTRLGDASACAKHGNAVWVAKGTYAENITVPAGARLYGGFAGNETQQSQRDWKANPTVVDGSGSTTLPVMLCGAGQTTIDGFTLRNGAGGVSLPDGSSVSLANDVIEANLQDGVSGSVTSSATLRDCVVTGNGASGIAIAGLTAGDTRISGNKTYGVFAMGPVTMYRCSIVGNGSGGLYAASVATVTESDVSGNGQEGVVLGQSGSVLAGSTVTNNGRYGIMASGTSRLVGNFVSRNHEYNVLVYMGSAEVWSNVIYGSGCGVLVSGTTSWLYNNTIVGHEREGVNVNYGKVIMANNILVHNGFGLAISTSFGSVGGYSHNLSFGSLFGNYMAFRPPVGQGNLTADPLFVDEANGDFHLRPGSPCIDAGDDAAAATAVTDVDGRARTMGPHVDIGAFETMVPYVVADVRSALGIAAGLATASSGDVAWLGAVGTARTLDLSNAVRISRKAAGLDPNP